MNLTWLDNAHIDLACPVCGVAGAKALLLEVDSPFAGRPRLRLARCADCGTCFFDDLAPPPYGGDAYSAETVKFYVEQGAGIDVMIEPLFRFRGLAVQRYMEVGCGYGFSLDFAQRALGWTVRGLDPSALAAQGRAALDLPIELDYLTAQSDFGAERCDLLLASEVIEHIPEPRHFLAPIRDRALAANGVLALTTPNADVIRPETSPASLMPVLSPGFHLILFSARSLAQLLRAEGFDHVEVWPKGNTLHAVATRSKDAFDRINAVASVDRDAYRRYLAARAAATAPGSDLSVGFHYRLFKELVNAGDYPAAMEVQAKLGADFRRRYGFDLVSPPAIVSMIPVDVDLPEFARRLPCNLAGVLFFSGILAMGQDNFAHAIDCFAAADKAGVGLRGALRAIGADDGETEDLVWQSRANTVLAMTHAAPAEAPAAAERLFDPAPASRAGEAGTMVPPALARVTRVLAFSRLVNRGCYQEASRLAEPVAGELGIAQSTLPRLNEMQLRALAETGDHPVEALFCLGILTLNHRADYLLSAALFDLARRAAGERLKLVPGSVSAATIMAAAERHRSLSLDYAAKVKQDAVHDPTVTADGAASRAAAGRGLLSRLVGKVRSRLEGRG